MDNIKYIDSHDIDRLIMEIKDHSYFDKLEKIRWFYRISLALIAIVLIFFLFLYTFILWWVYLLLWIVIAAKLTDIYNKKFKNIISLVLIESFKGKLLYDSSDKYFPSNLYGYGEDSIKLLGNGFNLYGKKLYNKLLYVVLIEISNYRFPLNKQVSITLNSNKVGFFGYLIPFILIWCWSFIFSAPVYVLVYFLFRNVPFFKEHIMLVRSFMSFFLALFFVKKFSNEGDKFENKKFNNLLIDKIGDEMDIWKLLTPDMMERLVSLVTNSGGHMWKFHFVDNKVYIEFDISSNYLYASLFFKKIDTQIINFFNDIKLIIDFANYLTHNVYEGKK